MRGEELGDVDAGSYWGGAQTNMRQTHDGPRCIQAAAGPYFGFAK